MLKQLIKILDLISYIVAGSWSKSSIPMDEKQATLQQLVSTLQQIAHLKTREEELWLEREIAREEQKKKGTITPQQTEQVRKEQEREVLTEEKTALALPETLRLEVNRLNFPIFALDDKDVKHRDSIKYVAVVERNGQKAEVSWVVAAPREFGFPGPFEKRVDVAIHELLNELKPPIENPITFTTYQLLRKMDYRTIGRTDYARVEHAFQRLMGTTIVSQFTFYSKAKREYLKDSFHLYDRIVVRGKSLPDGRVAEKNYIWLSQKYLDNINHGYTKPLSLPLYKKLHSLIAQRLYEFLGVKFYGVLNSAGTFYNIGYHDLCQLLPLTPQRERKYAKRQLKRAHTELIEQGYLERVEWDSWVLRYFPGPKAKREHEQSKMAQSSFRLNQPKDEEQEFKIKLLVQELRQRLKLDTHYAYYISRRVPHDIIRMAMSDAEAAYREGNITESVRQAFTHYLKDSCQREGIQLNFKSPDTEGRHNKNPQD